MRQISLEGAQVVMPGQNFGMALFLWIVFTIPALFCLIFGIALWHGRGLSLLAGYNTLSRKQQEQYDKRGLSRFTAKLVFALIPCILLWPIGFMIGMWVFWTGFGLFFLIIVGGVVYLNTGNRFQQKK